MLFHMLLRLPILNDEYPSAYHNDHIHWEVPDDFHQNATTNVVPSQLDEYI